MTMHLENRQLPGIDEARRVPAELSEEVRLQERVLRPEDVVPVRAQARELGREADGGAPIVRRDQGQQLGKLRLHGAADKGNPWKLKEKDE